jgi:uncharacterized protein YqhQ
MSADPTTLAASNGAASAEGGSEVMLADGRVMSAKDAPIGGQAVLEGVMMRGISTWAVAVRVPHELAEAKAAAKAATNGGGEDHHHHLTEEAEVALEGAATTLAGTGPASGNGAVGAAEDQPLGPIEIHTESFVPAMKKRRLWRLPIIRGVVALGESLKIGMKSLGISANAQLEEEEDLSGKTWGFTIFLSIVFAVGLFFVLPVTVANFWKDELGSSVAFVVVEKLIRIGIFLGYLYALSFVKDLRRVFEYHGAEHKVIACYEAGEPLEPERAQRFSRLHMRCGTSFLLIVMIIGVFVFAPIGRPALYWLILSRVLGIALVAGIAYEIIRFAGRNRRKRWVRVLMWPGLQLQKLTTREPSLDQLAVAIAALGAVLAVENPAESSEEDRLGMEVVA